MADIYGQTLGADQTVSLDVGPAASYVDFRGTGQKILEAQFPPKVAVEMQNVDRGNYVHRAAWQIRSESRRPVRDDDRHDEDPPQYEALRALRSFAVFEQCRARAPRTLPGPSRACSTATTRPQEAKDDLVVQVTDIGASVHVGYNSVLVLATSLSTGAPIADAAVTLRKDAKTVGKRPHGREGSRLPRPCPGCSCRAFPGVEGKAEVEMQRAKTGSSCTRPRCRA